MFQISKEKYEKLAAYAEQQEQTPEELFSTWVDDVIRQIETSHVTRVEEQADEELLSKEELRAKHPLLQLAGIFAIGEQGWVNRNDEYLAEAYADDHAQKS